MRHNQAADPDCAISQALAVVGDAWTLLLIRDVAGGMHRFDELQNALGISRKVLTERLKALVADEVLEKRLYHPHPPRYEYHLTERGRALLPVLVALQDWGGRYVLGDGTLSATSTADSAETRRVSALVGHRLPELDLAAASGGRADPVAAGRAWTVLYCYPGAYAPGAMGHPPGWGEIPGAVGCTLESCTYRDRMGEFTARDAAVYGVSTQRPDQLAAFGEHARIPFPLLSDAELQLAAALRLPTFRAAGAERLKRLTLVLDAGRTVRGVLYPVTDPAGSVEDALAILDGLTP
ncbi:winged helix-turn-helix transcriptional regulator [Streptomyces rubellomurinus]|uniref:HxlR family transcriptional regulator n=2 Tax=Streptomyces TaxID=1883 RepID=A0A0F2TK97_STRR3|nr:winged helix-turn-helix transcriptional regulator [Streptomyces rubellomurinus]KJS53538.1 HxlR family transcriptional regulator [Streptomyces rubellomurinus subsp. indigoferus]KJS62142.1 HxlR family transcriptional regulator [Streptomyces rubellomurinus]